MPLIVWLVFVVILIVPAWRIFRRAGLNPALALFALIPAVGALIVLFLLALMRWPATEPTDAEARR